ncbi:adenosylcobinamide-GDP ribazoletransferase [Clostridium botulinum]|uniref:adenosylcobinamide-GDP ribazoletransferase n=1 Tax=Clostridium botulinum TaxID=1491 RepID=UPI0004D8078F|nr:adenosylcobinamide-GDP ribazoletransferase [Clostridium botulinum]KEI00416.1 cobalamin synthase [Clostridium botulinum C/D str. BKT75002]KEI12674.1 cobalamin synthase [Clostridium botulinum C/D str. BKT2873]MCD3350546.1 adenosylcobinamide-GDP ribazoletransferase [Clostridium botulinum D/C]MCD3359564.1 adenosylcobinamide-GDP ribazoletransferase [Clostridium botulinum D/C]MCD3363318.1 adenosylcobinamide-GDP ribazoletransferase [Clostridium botulinum D/C]
MKNLILMIQFFTRIPINIEIDVKEDSFAKGIGYLPIVGLIIGMFNVATYIIASKLTTGMFPIVVALLANTMITGAFHIDGLADTCDGIFSSRKKERMLEIMKDSRVGTNGAIAIVFDFMFRWCLLSSLSEKYTLIAIVMAPVVAKTIVTLLMCFSVYARKEGGLGGVFLEKVKPFRVVIAFVICISLGCLVLGYKFLFILIITVAIMKMYKKLIYSKIDGMTGDTLGAANEIAEITFTLILLVFWRYYLI